jgi:uncharacterized membrane protein YphA (DoxX/SURF4 family)
VTAAAFGGSRLGAPVAAHSLAAFRILFGAILVVEAFRFFQGGWIDAHYVAPAFHFKYFGFEWIEPAPQPWLGVVFAGTGVLAACIAIGFLTRIAAALFFLAFGYVFLLEQARYLNHFWLVLLLAALLAWIPTDRALSVAAWWRARRGRAEPFVPLWCVLLVRAQLAVVYGFAAVAKMNGDWVRGQPLRMWLRERADLPWIGPWLGEPWVAWSFSWAGLALDLLVAPLLLVKRTRACMFVLICAFHVMNAALFDIGIFPWLSIAATTVFFAPGWPARPAARAAPVRPEPFRVSGATRLALAAWLAFQVAVPLRHFLHPGEVSWTEEGHRFSWHMKLRSKASKATFVVTDPLTQERLLVDPRAELEDWQARKMAGRPDMILQYAHHLAARFARAGPDGTLLRPVVRAEVHCSLNGRDPQPLIDPAVDLAAVRRSLRSASWIVPLREPLKQSWESTEVDFGD